MHRNKMIEKRSINIIYILFILKGLTLADILHKKYQKISWSVGPCNLEFMENCDSDNIRFFLYTKNTEVPAQIKLSDKELPKEFNTSAKTKILIHGYAGHLEFNGTLFMKEAYLVREAYNIIVVDWANLVRLPCYPVAVLNTWQAGKCTGRLLTHIMKRGRQRQRYAPSKLHLIGFSLGAHVASFAANFFTTKAKKKIGRITGLDPAMPFFTSSRTAYKLDKSDASFVDIIHTNSGVFGKIEATGHADFYVDGGVMQVACRNAYNPHLCSHLMSTLYYAKSIIIRKQQSGLFNVSSCSDLLEMLFGKCTRDTRTYMGDGCSSKTRGIFHVATEQMASYLSNGN